MFRRFLAGGPHIPWLLPAPVHQAQLSAASASASVVATTTTTTMTRAMATVSTARDAAPNPPKTAIVLMNMGGPATLPAVGSFLLNLFSDGDLIPIPFQKYLAPWIAKRRTPKIEDQYAKIGGGSPIGHWTSKQGQLLEVLMDRISPSSAPHKSYIAFRYADPLTETTLDEMKRDGVTDAVALSLYPQYSCSTTGSSLNQMYRKLKVLDPQGSIRWSVIDRWPTHRLLVETFARHVETSLKEYPADARDNVSIIFSAHSLPMSVVNRGDTYPQEVAATVQAVMERLAVKNPYRLVWQSQVGPAAWLGPKTNDVIQGYAKMVDGNKPKELLCVPIAFVSDHIETLFELDLEYGHLAKEAGIGFKRVESLNDDPLFIQALGELVKSHLEEGRRPSAQLFTRCPMCTSKDCGETKAFFKKQLETRF